jgi:hypothetical protein
VVLEVYEARGAETVQDLASDLFLFFWGSMEE